MQFVGKILGPSCECGAVLGSMMSYDNQATAAVRGWWRCWVCGGGRADSQSGSSETRQAGGILHGMSFEYGEW